MSVSSSNSVQNLADTPRVSIIILNWNGKALLKKCLDSLKTRTAYKNYKIVVVDNGSSDNSSEMVTNRFPWVEIIPLTHNSGYPAGNNKGIAYALANHNPNYVLLLNNDTETVQDNWLKRMVGVAESENNIGLVGCKLIRPDFSTQYLGTKITIKGLSWLNPETNKVVPEIFEVDAILGACFLIKKAVIDKIGFLDVGFSPFSDEESDFCMRAKKAGYKVLMASTVAVVHKGGASVDKIDSDYVTFVRRRNQIRFMLLNFPFSWLLARVPCEVLIFARCFIIKNLNRKRMFPLKLRSGMDMISNLKINIYGWLCNIIGFREILRKRANRTFRLT